MATLIETVIQKAGLCAPDVIEELPSGEKYRKGNGSILATEVPFDSKGDTEFKAQEKLAKQVAELVRLKPTDTNCVMLVRKDIETTKVCEGRFYATALLSIIYLPQNETISRPNL